MKANRLHFAMGVITMCSALVCPRTALALIMSQAGNNPVTDPGWPAGAMAVANLPSRVGYWEGPPFGGGQYEFDYRGDTDALNAALTNFAAIRAPALDIVLHDGPQTNVFLGLDNPNSGPSAARLDWSFTVWIPASFHRLYNNPAQGFLLFGFGQPLDPPRMDIYVGDGLVDWAKVKMPENVHVRDDRYAAARVKPVGGALVHMDIYDMATGKPVTGVHVTVIRRTNDTPKLEYATIAEVKGDDSGRVDVAKIPAGWQKMTLEAPGYVSESLGEEYYTERTYKELTIQLAKPASVSGTTVDTEGKPLKGVKVQAFRMMGIDGRGYPALTAVEATTDNAGRFELNGLPSGYVVLFASKPGQHFDDVNKIHSVPGENVVLRLTGAGGITVRFSDKSGKPLPTVSGRQVWVSVESATPQETPGWRNSGFADADGKCEFKDVPPGEYRVTTRTNPGDNNPKHTSDRVIHVKAGESTTEDVTYE